MALASSRPPSQSMQALKDFDYFYQVDIDCREIDLIKLHSFVGCWAEEPKREVLVNVNVTVNIEEYAPQIRDKVAWWLGTLDASQLSALHWWTGVWR